MKVLIDVPDEVYKKIQDSNVDESLMIEPYKWIKNGVPLPKGHGRLIDADELYGDFIDGTEGYDCQTWNRSEIGDVIEYAPTIIEKDEEQS